MTNEMTPQQQRIFTLQAGRNWGPFTDAETDHLNTEFKRKKSKPSDVQRPYMADLIRILQPGETLDNLRTIQMPGERP